MKSYLISLDRERHLRLDANAIADFEGAYGLPFSMALKLDAGINFTRCLLWAGLHGEDPTLTLKQAGDLIDGWMASREGARWEEVTLILFKILMDVGWVRKPDEKNPETPDEKSPGE